MTSASSSLPRSNDRECNRTRAANHDAARAMHRSARGEGNTFTWRVDGVELREGRTTGTHLTIHGPLRFDLVLTSAKGDEIRVLITEADDARAYFLDRDIPRWIKLFAQNLAGHLDDDVHRLTIVQEEQGWVRTNQTLLFGATCATRAAGVAITNLGVCVFGALRNEVLALFGGGAG